MKNETSNAICAIIITVVAIGGIFLAGHISEAAGKHRSDKEWEQKLSEKGWGEYKFDSKTGKVTFEIKENKP